jgi:hypothetical protein
LKYGAAAAQALAVVVTMLVDQEVRAHMQEKY